MPRTEEKALNPDETSVLMKPSGSPFNFQKHMKLSVIMPVYNERRTIKTAVEQVLAAPIDLQELIIVDDGSTDGTRDIIANEIRNPLCKPVFHPTNRGKGASIRTALKEVTGDIVVIQDGDLEYDPQDLPALLKPILDQKADVVYGSRFTGAGPHRVAFFWHMVGNKLLTFLSNMLTNINLTDVETCYKMFRREILQQVTLEEDRFGFEPEVTAKAAKLGCRIYEVGISYSGRTYAEGKKIQWPDGMAAVWAILKYNIWGRP